MEFLGGSSLAPTEQSTPQELRFWGASSDHILRRSQLPESYSAIKVEFDQYGETSQSRVGLYNNLALSNHHDDTHHYALEVSQLQSPDGSPHNGKSYLHLANEGINEGHFSTIHNNPQQRHQRVPPPSASTAQLPITQTISINNTTYRYFPLSSTANSRPLTGPVLLKVGIDNELADVDVSLRIKDRFIVRGHALFDHAAIQDHATIRQDELDAIDTAHPLPQLTMMGEQQQSRTTEQLIMGRKTALKKLAQQHSLKSAINSKTFSYGGELTYNGPTYSLGLKCTSFDKVLGCHATKSFNPSSLLSASPSATTKIDSNQINNKAGTTFPQFTTNPTWFLPSALDVGIEYHIKYDDLQDTFTIGTVASWDEFHQGLNKPNIKQWRLKKTTFDQDDKVHFTDFLYPSLNNTPSITPSTTKPIAIIDNGNHIANGSNHGQDSYDVITTTTLPTSLQMVVNGIGAVGFGFTTSLYDELKRVTIPPRHDGSKEAYNHNNHKNTNNNNNNHAESNGHHLNTPTLRFNHTTYPLRFGTPANVIAVPLLNIDTNGAVSVGASKDAHGIDHALLRGDKGTKDTHFLAQFIPHIAYDLSSGLSNLFTTATSFPLNLVTPLFNLNTPWIYEQFNTHNEIISHSSLLLGTKLEYSIGSRESGFHCGFEHVNHTFQRQYIRNNDSEDFVKNNSTTTNQGNPSNNNISQTIVSPWAMTSSAQNTISISTTKGLAYDYTVQYSPLSYLSPSLLSASGPISWWNKPQSTDQNEILTIENNFQNKETLKKWFVQGYNENHARSLPTFYFNCGLSTLLPFQLTENWFRTHHSFPLLSMPHQPYQELDATPCAQQQRQPNSGIQNTNLAVQSWYPASYTHNGNDIINSTTRESQIFLDQSSSSILSTTSATPTLLPPQTVLSTNKHDCVQPILNSNGDSKAASVNADDITRRLSLCGQNGEWKSISKSGATPSPIWNPYEGIKVNIGFGFDV